MSISEMWVSCDICGYHETYVGIMRHMWVSYDICGYHETLHGIFPESSTKFIYFAERSRNNSGEFKVQKYRLKKKIAEGILPICILDAKRHVKICERFFPF